MAEFHSLLKRQLKNIFGSVEAAPKGVEAFIAAVDAAYKQSDIDRSQLERSFDLSSQELLQANSEMRALNQASPDIYFRMDLGGKILDYNAGSTKDLYVAPEQFIGKRVTDIMPPPVAEKIAKAIQGVREVKTLVTIEYELEMPQGVLAFEARLFPLLEDQVIAIVRNVTERKKTELDLKKKVDELEEFNQLAVGRELKMIDLEKQIKQLKSKE